MYETKIVHIQNVNFTYNKARSGGSIAIEMHSFLFILNSIFYQNIVYEHGGAIYFNSHQNYNKSSISISDCICYNFHSSSSTLGQNGIALLTVLNVLIMVMKTVNFEIIVIDSASVETAIELKLKHLLMTRVNYKSSSSLVYFLDVSSLSSLRFTVISFECPISV